MENGYIGNIYYNDKENVTYKIYDNYNNEIQYNEIIYTQVNQGYTTQIYIDTANIISGNTYYIDIYYKNILYDQYGYGNTIIIQNTEEPETPSQDITPIIVGIENLNNTIKSGNQEIINQLKSGEQKAEERQSFWENAYNNLFTLNSGEAEEILTNFYEDIDLQIGSGEENTIKQIASVLQGQANDFIISWNDIYLPNLKQNEPILLIKQGQINFSEEVRNNEALARAKGYLNIIISTILLILLLFNYGDTLMRLLGTTNRFIDDEEVSYEVMNITNDDMLPPTNMPIPYSQSRDYRYKVWHAYFKRRK